MSLPISHTNSQQVVDDQSHGLIPTVIHMFSSFSHFAFRCYLFLVLFLPSFYASRFRSPTDEIIGDSFHDLLAEWKMMNLASSFILSIVMAIFQLSSSMTDVPTRTTGFMSMAFAYVSIIYTWIYMIHFSVQNNRTMNPGDVESEYVWWNAWVFLALPAIMTTWSVIWFSAVLLLIIWNVNASGYASPPVPIPQDPGSTPPITMFVWEYIPSAGVTVVLAIGGVYLILIICALRRR